MSWRIHVGNKAEKQLRILPGKERERMGEIIEEIGRNPFGGDIQKLGGVENTWRRRVGSYRIKYELLLKERVVYVFEVIRRTSETY